MSQIELAQNRQKDYLTYSIFCPNYESEVRINAYSLWKSKIFKLTSDLLWYVFLFLLFKAYNLKSDFRFVIRTESIIFLSKYRQIMIMSPIATKLFQAKPHMKGFTTV
jgi:hypothetical protein